MSSIENEAGFMSLADLAAMDAQAEGIAVLTSRLPAAGMYIVRGKEVKASESRKEGEPPLFSFIFTAEILEAKPLDKEVDAERLVGRTLTERYTLWPTDFREAVGLMMGRYKIIGLPFEGRMGGVEGQEPGWLDGLTGHLFQVRVRHFTDKNNNERAGFDWLPYKQEGEEKAA